VIDVSRGSDDDVFRVWHMRGVAINDASEAHLDGQMTPRKRRHLQFACYAELPLQS
jgi:hypothetical protein